CDGLLEVDFANALTAIGDSAFRHCDQLVTVDLPDTTVTVGSDAFNACGKLEAVKLGRGVTEVSHRAFANCPLLTEITIADAMSMAHYDGHTSFAFHNTPIALVHVPATVTSIPENFYNKATIAEFDCAGNGVQDYFDVDGVLYHRVEYTAAQTLVKVPHSMDLPDTYTVYANTTAIGNKAFYENDTFIELKLCKGLLTIGTEAFYGCDYLQNVDFGNALTSIGDSAFRHCDRLLLVTLPDTTVTVGSDAFNECGWLETVKLGRGVTDVSHRAFANCPKLTEITISDTIGMAHYDGHTSFAFHNTPITVVHVPATVKSIPENFYKKATIAAFDCAGDGKNGYFDVDGVLYHRDRYTETQTLVKVPAAMELTGTFTVCAGTTVINAESVQGHDTFTDLVLPEGLLSIGIHAFINCNVLEEVVIPNSVTQILDYAFHSCDWLSKVTIGKNVTLLGYNAFSENGKLVEMIFRGNAPEVGKNVFNNLPAEFTVYYPEEATGWSTPTWNGVAAYPYAPDKAAYKINAIEICDLNGGSLDAIPEESFHAVISVTCLDEEQTDAAVLLAAYGEDGRFITWVYIALNGCPKDVTMTFTFPVSNTSGAVDHLQAFVVEGIGNMMPMGETVVFGK
ncbi:MAG: leucine-rich repeat domain-containing protein, partial [Clostridia bacterium]|nr:leucine-rich repeat domain-containing protein [Clostridia bacterium]